MELLVDNRPRGLVPTQARRCQEGAERHFSFIHCLESVCAPGAVLDLKVQQGADTSPVLVGLMV